MDMQKNLLELEEAAQRVSDGLAAIRIMVIGLEGAGSEYTGAFHAIWDYLSDANSLNRSGLLMMQIHRFI